MSRLRASDGVTLHVEAHGSGPGLLFSCPLNTTRENWRPQVAPLVAAGWRVMLWDYRGHGLSDAPREAEAYTMKRVVADLGEVLGELAPGEPAVLAGLSFGGLASLHFALEAPARVRALVLIDSGPGFKKPEAQARWEASIERTASYLEAKGLEAFVASRARSLLVGDRPDTPAAQAALAAVAAQTVHGLAQFGRRVAGPAPPVIDRLGEISCPTLVLVGERDEAYLRAADVLAARIPGARANTLPGLGHVVNLEDPEAFAGALLPFLAELPPLAEPA